MQMHNLVASLALITLTGTVACADKIEFDVSIAGISAGVLAIDGSEVDGRYEVRGSARSNRLISAIVDMRVDAVSTGSVNGNTYRPNSYSAVSREKNKQTKRDFRYSGGIPTVSEDPPRSKPRKYAVAPSTQAGSLDPLTAIFALLRDRPKALACDLDFQLYDGARSSRVVMSKARPDGTAMTCTGTYTRLAGYSPSDMKKRNNWVVTTQYEAGSGGTMEVETLSFSTDLGGIRLRRR